jgi:hypothetical protein
MAAGASSTLGRALSWGGGDEREWFDTGLALNGAAREGLEAEHLAVGGEGREQGPEGEAASGAAAALGLGVRRRERECRAGRRLLSRSR